MPFSGSSNSSCDEGHWKEDLWEKVRRMGVSQAEKGRLIDPSSSLAEVTFHLLCCSPLFIPFVFSSYLSLELCIGLLTGLPVSSFSQSNVASSLPSLTLAHWWLTETIWLQSSSTDSSTNSFSVSPQLPCVQISWVD